MSQDTKKEGVGVLLVNMGGPRNADEIEPYLREIFLDPMIIDMPLGFLVRPILAVWIAKRRAPVVEKRYDVIGGGSPLSEETRAQASALAAELGCPVHYGMRYGAPSLEDAVNRLSREGVETIVVLPLFPQYCRATTGSALLALRRMNIELDKLRVVNHHFDHPLHIRALQHRLRDGLDAVAQPELRTHVLFTAHSIPLKMVRGGDPYVDQVVATYEAVSRDLPDTVSHSLAFQSRMGPAKWQGPDLNEALQEIQSSGAQALVIQTLSFVSENLETLYDLDHVFTRHCQLAGLHPVLRVPTLSNDPSYIQALADLVRENLEE